MKARTRQVRQERLVRQVRKLRLKAYQSSNVIVELESKKKTSTTSQRMYCLQAYQSSYVIVEAKI